MSLINHFSEYNARRVMNDIAIMIVKKPFKYTDYVRPACLPSPDFTFNNGRMIISGMSFFKDMSHIL